VLASTQITVILLQGEVPVDTISVCACPLCDEWEETVKGRQEKKEEKTRMLNDGEMIKPYGTRKQFRRHLGRHMEQLALFALPPNDAELDDDSTEGEEDKDEYQTGDAYMSYFDMPGREGLELRYMASQDPHDAAARFFAEHKLPVTQTAIYEVAVWIKQRLQAYDGSRSANEPASGYRLGGVAGIMRPLFRLEWIRELPDIYPTGQKTKWEFDLSQMWKLVDENGVTTQTHLDAKQKLYEFSNWLYAKLRADRELQGEYGVSMHHDQEISPKPPSRIHPMNQFTDSNTTVFVGDLSEYVTEDELRSFFQGFGEITYVKIPPGKGCGFVQFIQRDAAEMAINQMQGYPIGNSRIRLSWGPVGTPYCPVTPPPQGQSVGMPPAHSYIGSRDAPVERSFPELPQRDTAANPHEESELKASHQKQEEGATELETAEQEVRKPADLEKEIAQNLALFKEAGQSTARPAATAIAELDQTKKEFDAGPAPTDEETPENSRTPDLAIPTTSATDLTTADPWQPYNRGNIWGDIPEIERYIGSLQKSRKSNQSVLQGYSSESAELSSPEASMAGS
jgi:RNA recognition motif-containing protein